MKFGIAGLLSVSAALIITGALIGESAKADARPKSESSADLQAQFRTSDRCVACHNGLKTGSGEDVSIGFAWRASIMANSSRDPYWQGSVRRESMDHPESQAAIEDECSICHMPITHLAAKSECGKAEIFANLPISASTAAKQAAADGVSCSVCHQIEEARLGTSESYNGNVVVQGSQNKDARSEYGPFDVGGGHQRVMQSSTGGFMPMRGDHIRGSALCGSCHTLKTKALGPDGKEIGSLPEQMPYEEWLHSDYNGKSTCQDCHMPEVHEAVPITAVFGEPRQGLHRHDFVGANFLMDRILNEHRNELGVVATSEELAAAANQTIRFLKTESARVSITELRTDADGISFDVAVENLTGHKLPTAYPSRRAWLHVVVSDSSGAKVFESGALNADGSIVGNDNDADPLRFEPHYTEITSPEQVEIFEPILKDSQGRVTTGLLSAVGYLKDNRILPSGFNKQTAAPDIAVVGEAMNDANFRAKTASVRYVVRTDARGPFKVRAELLYQPIGFRWAHNLGGYKASEPQRFVGYYESESHSSATVLATASSEETR